MGIVAVIVAASAFAVFGIVKGVQYVNAVKEEHFRDELRHGDRYLEKLDYEQAIASYQAAIKIDPKDYRPYIGIAKAYIGLGDYEAAKEILEEGYKVTGNKKIRDMLKEVEAALESRTKLNGMVITGSMDMNDSVPLENAKITLEKKGGSQYQGSAETDENGNFVFEDLCAGKYDMVIEAEDYLTIEQEIEVYPGQDEMYNPVAVMIPKEYSGEGRACGRIIDAVTGYGVDGLTLSIRSGYNRLHGGIVETTETEGEGIYKTPKLPAGYYTIEIEDERDVEEHYLISYINVRVFGDEDTYEQNGSVSTKLTEGQIRIVMSWGATPNDLDSHLFCEFDTGERHMNFFGNSVYSDPENDERVVDLDLDDTDRYGPETTTIYSKRPGEYIFGVYNYSGGSMDALQKSQAVVQVYLGNSAAPTYVYYVPQEEGYYWEVFSYDGESERITPINQMYDSYSERDYYSYDMGGW